MNTKIKLLAWFFLVALFVTFSSCEKDLYEDSIINTNREVRSEFVTGNNAKIIVNRLTKTLKKKFVLDDMGIGRISMSSIGIVQYDEIVKITDTTGQSTYTFKVEHPSSSISKFYNLVLQEKAGGNIVKLMEYSMSQEFAQLFEETFNYKNFNGTLTTYTIINETPCPDEDIIVTVGQVPAPGSGNGGVPIGTVPGGTLPVPGTGPGPSTGPGGPTTIPGTGGPITVTNPGNGSGTGTGPFQVLTPAELMIDCISEGNIWWYDDEEGEWSCIESPRHFRMVVPSIDPVLQPCNPSYYAVVITPNTPCESNFLNSCDDDQREWLWVQLRDYNTTIYTDIMAYVNGNVVGQCSTERENIAKELIREIKRGSKIDFQNKIIIDSSFVNNQKANCVYNKMRSINAFNKALIPFETTTPVAFLKLIVEDMGNNGRAVTDPPTDNLNIITIKINNSPIYHYGINYQANLLLAQTIIHEVIHAEIYRKTMIAISVGSYVEDPTVVRNALSSSEFDILSNYFRLGHDWPHSYMADHMRNTIARVTQEFATGIAVTTPSEYYKTLAWRGLMHYGTVASWTQIVGSNPNSPSQVAIIIDQTINDYETLHANETCQ